MHHSTLFEEIILPGLMVLGIYSAIIIPTYFLLRKRYSGFWRIFLVIWFEIMIFFPASLYLEFKSNFKTVYIDINFLIIIISSFLYLFLPLFLRKRINQNKKGETYFVAYFLVFLSIFAQIYTIMLIMAWGASKLLNLE